MIDVREYVQATLDDALSCDGIQSFWLRHIETQEPAREYIVYTLGGVTPDAYADNRAFIRTASVTFRYYYSEEFTLTPKGREHIRKTEKRIAKALRRAGFSLPDGWFDAGDIDDIGYGTTVFEADLQEVDGWRP